MNIVLLAHPEFLSSQSMPRYTNWLAEGMKKRGHYVEIWCPEAIAYRIPAPNALKKWLGYLDQYIFFPIQLKILRKKHAGSALYVFTDQALGPWVPYLSSLPHIIHCHDFLAQRSAIGEISENQIRWTGKAYQAYIKRGYRKGRNFISVSEKTQTDLHRFLTAPFNISEIIYNGLTREFRPTAKPMSVRERLGKAIGFDLSAGFLMHIGGNQWYKNRPGVIQIYTAWRDFSALRLPLILIGPRPSRALLKAYRQSRYQEDICFLMNGDDLLVQDFYSCASTLLFPSLAEGFGWPIIEAMASGCPVVTTNEPPMNEIARSAAVYIDKMPYGDAKRKEEWAKNSASILDHLLNSPPLLNNLREEGIQNSKRFNAEAALDKIEQIYQHIVVKQESA